MAKEFFQDILRALRPRQRPQSARGWAQKIFLEDGRLKLLALIIALALWFGVTANRTPATFIVPNVALNFRVAPNLTISNDLRQSIEITLSGDKYTLDRINPTELVAYMDVSDLAAGEHSFALRNGERLSIGLPDGVTVIDTQPNSLAVRLEPRIEKELPVRVRYEGKLPDGYELRGINISPERVRVRGAASRVNALSQAPTVSISLDGHREDFSVAQLTLNISDKRVELLDETVRADFIISEAGAEKTLPNVEVRSASGAGVVPARSDITVYAPRSVLSQIKAEDLRLVLTPTDDGKLAAQLEILRADLQGKVTLRAVATDLKHFYILPQ